MTFFAQFGQQIVNGVTIGSIYALLSLGYSMVYGILEMLNFAHGDVFMIGAYIGWALLGLLLPTQIIAAVPNRFFVIVIVLLGAVAGCSALGWMIERFAYRPLRGAARLAPLISALGVSIILQNAIMLGVGTRAKVYESHRLIPPEMHIQFGGVVISFTRLLVIGVALLLMAVLDTFIRRTPIGKAMRATAQDREAASYMGIDPDKIIAFTFMLGSALAGAGGVLVGIYYTQVDFYMGVASGLKAFIAAVLGGVGNLRGAMLGGLLLGVAESLGVMFVAPVYKDIIAFSILVAVLLAKPSGLLGMQVPDKT